MTHAPLQYRLISGSSVNCEAEERIFNLLKSITDRTSSHHHGHIVGNLMLRYQAERNIERRITEEKTYQNDVSKKYHYLTEHTQTQRNTFFTKEFIGKNPKAWKCHLEQISDYILCGEKVWWNEDQYIVEFLDTTHDYEHQSKGPTLKHFRSTSLKEVETYLKSCWEKCEENQVPMPFTQEEGFKEIMESEYLTAENNKCNEACEMQPASEVMFQTEPENGLDDVIDLEVVSLTSASTNSTNSSFCLPTNVLPPSTNSQSTPKRSQSTPKSNKYSDKNLATPKLSPINSNSFKSKEAKMIFDVIGYDLNICKLDKAKCKVKDFLNQS